jgi:hypothetical protein
MIRVHLTERFFLEMALATAGEPTMTVCEKQAPM